MKIIPYIIKKGGIDFNREYRKGELSHACQCQPSLKRAIKKNGKGFTLDELAEQAVEDGYLQDRDVYGLLDLIYQNSEHPQEAEYQAIREAMRRERLVSRIIRKADHFVTIGYYEKALQVLEAVSEAVNTIRQRIAEIIFYMPLLRRA
jgi:hypothetical protein